MSEVLPVTILLREENGEFIPDSLTDKIRLDNFHSQVEKGARISAMYEVITDDGTHAQLNYFHKLCRVISEDTGQPVEDIHTPQGTIRGVKSEAKIKGGLWASKTTLKSCSTFSKSDFTAAIAGAVELGNDLGINLYAI